MNSWKKKKKTFSFSQVHKLYLFFKEFIFGLVNSQDQKQDLETKKKFHFFGLAKMKKGDK